MPRPVSQAFLREPDKNLWIAPDRLPSNLDAAVYKHTVLSLDTFTRDQRLVC